MKEIYCSFEGKLNVDCRFGYVLYLLNNGNLRLDYLSIETGIKDRTIIFKPTDHYGLDTQWDLQKCEDLHEIASNGPNDDFILFYSR